MSIKCALFKIIYFFDEPAQKVLSVFNKLIVLYNLNLITKNYKVECNTIKQPNNNEGVFYAVTLR